MESRTPVSSLGRMHNSRYTIPALKLLYHKEMRHSQQKSLKRGNFTDWSGRQDSNLRPQLPKSCALPTVLRPEDLKISYHELFFLSIPTKPSMVLKFI